MTASTQTNTTASEASAMPAVFRLAEASAIPPRRACPRGYTAVERSLWRQMTESTGAHVCDSGGAYGRHWERNRVMHDLKARPFATIDLEMGPDSPDVSVSTFHRLSGQLACAPGINRRLARFNRQYDPRNVRSWLDVSEAFAAGIDPNFEYYLSYNNEHSVLDQGVQFVSFTDDKSGAKYVLLQVHGGCDWRGGYSEPVAYKVGDADAFLLSLQEWSASCQCTDGHGGRLFMYMDTGELLEDGLDRWPEKWAVSGANGTARCGECGEEVLVS